MATRAIRPKRDEGPLKDWQAPPERAPSVMRSDRPFVIRVIAFIALVLTAVGGLAMIMAAYGRNYLIGPEWGFFWFTIGVAGLVFQAFSDPDAAYRRTYGALGLVLLFMAAILRVMPSSQGMGAYFLPYGIPCLALALLFLVAVARHETDEFWKKLIVRALGIAGWIMVIWGFRFVRRIDQDAFAAEGVPVLLLGLVYMAAFISLQERGSLLAHRTGQILALIGLGSFAGGLLGSIFSNAPGDSYLVPQGLLLMGLGIIYGMFGLAVFSDNILVVLTRRELSAFFYSPIAYLVILGMSLVGFCMYWLFVVQLRRGPIPEPIVAHYIISFVPVVCLIFVVPVLTMRLLSEEKRSGTLEVLLTAPVHEVSIVLSKFIAVLIFYILACAPWGLYLIALRVVGKEPFDYRPMLSFLITLTVSGGGFLAVGIFFSSITRNQIIAAVLTFAVMMGLSLVYFLARMIGTENQFLTYISFLDLWISSLEGQFAPRFLLFHVSVTVFFLYMTVKVLEARKWA